MYARVTTLSVVALLAACISGCTRTAEVLDAEEVSSPLLTRAYDLADSGDTDGAIRLYTKALETNPRNARAHLDMALLFDDRLKDGVRAVYHYERYLEIRPQTEKRQMIQDRVRLARASLAGLISATSTRTDEQLERVLKENTLLKDELKKAQQEIAALKRAAAHSPAPPPPTEIRRPQEPPPPPVTAHTERAPLTYRVKSGDTLYRISGTVYNDPNMWKKIYEANRASLDAAGRLTVGQVLVIP